MGEMPSLDFFTSLRSELGLKVLLLSDTHGLIREVGEIITAFQPDRLLHCGDSEVEPTHPPFQKMTMVKGNMDYGVELPLTRTLHWKGLTITITHGHHYHVKRGLSELKELAQQTKANILLFGHTHFPLCQMEEGVLYINPGSLLHPRGYPYPSFVMMDLEEETGGGYWIEVSYYHRSSMTRLSDLGGRYHIPS